MASEQISWQYDGQQFDMGLDRLGTGKTILLLPALSSISMREEMLPLQERLSASYATVSSDWPGFGTLSKPFVDWRPEVYVDYLDYLLREVVPNPYAIIAAGHAAGYVLRYASDHDKVAERLVLLSPTWRGPLPTMMNGYRPMFPKIARAVDRPIIGPPLYQLNVNRFVVGLMMRGHVYGDAAWITRQRMQDKLRVTTADGGRHGSARFVTGRLDPFNSRDAFLLAAKGLGMPILNLFAATAPRKSRGEMEALAELDNIETVRLSRGKLSFYEEHPDDTAGVLSAFLAGEPLAGQQDQSAASVEGQTSPA